MRAELTHSERHIEFTPASVTDAEPTEVRYALALRERLQEDMATAGRGEVRAT